MTIPDRYDAFWIPGPDELDMDKGLRAGYGWLDSASYEGERIVVMPAKKMLNNRRSLAEATRYHVVSPRARGIPYSSAGPVLAVWPNAETLELAQRVAFASALCVIPYRHDITWWIARTSAVNLTKPGAEPAQLPTLEPAVTGALDSILRFGGHNSFVGGGEKEETVRELRAMLAAGYRPEPVDVENYARATGETNVDGARRLRELYDKILSGSQIRDYRGHAI